MPISSVGNLPDANLNTNLIQMTVVLRDRVHVWHEQQGDYLKTSQGRRGPTGAAQRWAFICEANTPAVPRFKGVSEYADQSTRWDKRRHRKQVPGSLPLRSSHRLTSVKNPLSRDVRQTNPPPGMSITQGKPCGPAAEGVEMTRRRGCFTVPPHCGWVCALPLDRVHPLATSADFSGWRPSGVQSALTSDTRGSEVILACPLDSPTCL